MAGLQQQDGATLMQQVMYSHRHYRLGRPAWQACAHRQGHVRLAFAKALSITELA